MQRITKDDSDIDIILSQSPYGAKWFATTPRWKVLWVKTSQSPYGAKWFATENEVLANAPLNPAVAIPLRG